MKGIGPHMQHSRFSLYKLVSAEGELFFSIPFLTLFDANKTGSGNVALKSDVEIRPNKYKFP